MTLRAVHVLPSIGQEASGPSYSVPRLCLALAGANVDVSLHVLARGVPPSWDGLSIHQHPEWRGIVTPIGASPAMHKALRREALRAPPVVLHNHSLWMMPNVYPGLVVARTRSRLVTSPRGVFDAWAVRRSRWKKRLMWPLLQRYTVERTDCFHATSSREYANIRSAGFRAPIAVIPNGIDIPSLTPQALATPRRLVFLGRLHPVKGLDILLRAWTLVARRFPEWELHIFGPDERGYGAEMAALAAAMGARNVLFRGPVYGAEKWRQLAAASLFVLPTHTENFGLAVAEALASGVPAIVTQGAPWQGLERESCGWWIEHGVDALVGSLETAMAKDAETLSAMGARGREWMVREFSWSRVGAMMARTYSWLFEGGASPEWVEVD